MAFSLKKWRIALTKPVKNAIEYAVEYVQGGTTTSLNDHLIDAVEAHTASAIDTVDADSRFVAEDVEGCLDELAGSGRATETVVQNASDVLTVKGVGWSDETIHNNASDIDLDETAIGAGTFGTGLSTVGDTGQLLVTSRIAGTAGNGVTLTLIADADIAGTVAVSGTDVTCQVDTGVSTAEEIAAWVNGHFLATEIMYVTEGTPGAMDFADVATTAGGADNVVYTVDVGSLVLATANFADTGKTPSLYAGQQLNADAIDVLNTRDVHLDNMESGIYKHPLMAVITYDFAVDPALGNGGSIDLHRGRTIIPDNAIIMNVAYDVVTETAGGDVVLATKTGTAALTGTISAAASGLALGIPDFATVGEWVKTAAVEGLTLTEQSTGAMSAGKIHFYIQYVVSE